MSWTKRNILNAAFSEIGMADYVFDLQAEDLQDALNRLDSLMAQWEGEGFGTGYVVTDDPADIAIGGTSGIRADLVLPVIHNLAVQIAPSYGKTPSPTTLGAARKGYSIAQRGKSVPTKAANTTVTPAGAGYLPYYGDRYLEPDS